MDWSKDKIISNIETLRKDSLYLKESEVKEKYSEFIEKFPRLYSLSIEPNFDIKSIEMMLNFRQKAIDENMPDMVRDVTIGEELAKRYLYPVVGEPTINQKRDAAKKIAKKY
jgi:hypothetical protein